MENQEDHLMTYRALLFAKFAHAGQVRKYTGRDYIVHPVRVAAMVSAHGGDSDMVAAAYLHDVIEDCNVWVGELRHHFNNRIASLVVELTNRSKESTKNRAGRKAMDRARLSGCSHAAKLIKLADVWDNTQSIIQHDPKFAELWCDETEALIPHIQVGSPKLANEIVTAITTFRSTVASNA